MKFLIVALVAFIILRIPSLYEPHWYGDEGVYAAITYGIENGRQLYVNLWDNKPMLIYWLYGLGDASNRLLFIRLLNMSVGIVSLIGLHFLLKKFKVNTAAHAIGLGIFVYLMGFPILEGNITNAENLFIPLTILGYLAILQKKPFYTVSGLLFGIGFMLKFHPIFDFAAVLLYLLITRKKLKHTVLLIAGFALPNILQYIYWHFNGNLMPALQTIFFNNFGYTQSYSSGVRSLPLKTAVLGLASLALAKKYLDDTVSPKKLLIVLMVMFEAYGVLFGGRQYLHYMIQIVPAAVIAGALIAQKIQKSNGVTQLKYIIGTTFVVFLFLNIFYQGEGEATRQSIPKYYGKFYDYATGKEPYFLHGTDEVFANVDHALQKYHSKNIYVYSNNAWIYDVLQIVPPAKVVVAYHRWFIPDGEFINSLKEAKTDIILMEVGMESYDKLNEYLVQEYRFSEQVENYDVWFRDQK